MHRLELIAMVKDGDYSNLRTICSIQSACKIISGKCNSQEDFSYQRISHLRRVFSYIDMAEFYSTGGTSNQNLILKSVPSLHSIASQIMRRL